MLHQSPTRQQSWPEPPPEGEPKKRRKEQWLSPKSQDGCQSNSATCADIKHHCILTFHMSCNSAFFCDCPQRKPKKGSLSWCCLRIRFLLSYFIWRYARVDTTNRSGEYRKGKDNQNVPIPYFITFLRSLQPKISVNPLFVKVFSSQKCIMIVWAYVCLKD